MYISMQGNRRPAGMLLAALLLVAVADAAARGAAHTGGGHATAGMTMTMTMAASLLVSAAGVADSVFNPNKAVCVRLCAAKGPGDSYTGARGCNAYNQCPG
ncbi:hypothetical protein BRADI_4g03987v3 [Brachypodium distachyon]|uniref:Uncharacterized protein n=1 Tax=Brachypodium distachyon TaxID=15368 RepID=A0A2K2CKC5_BRADI|nr:hypothetical protein BRADI_4g03987v3 [Brachypodium distachyon]